MRRIVADLFEPNRWFYWVDFLLCSAVAWTAVFVALAHTVPKRFRWRLSWAAVALAGVSGYVGLLELWLLLD